MVVLDLVPNDQIREAALQAVMKGRSWSDIAVHSGFIHPNRRGDTTRLKRCLGIYPESTSWRKRYVAGRCFTNKRMTYSNAVSIIRALKLDPVDFDL